MGPITWSTDSNKILVLYNTIISKYNTKKSAKAKIIKKFIFFAISEDSAFNTSGRQFFNFINLESYVTSN
jgi:hypothetical protein